MNGFTLKLIAIITMMIDHTGAILLPDQIWFRIIGRMAFPIFAFLLVEGFFHTRNIYKYMFRLGLFALISEIPFDLAFENQLISTGGQNIYFTLLIGMAMIGLIEWVRNKYGTDSMNTRLLSICIFVLSCLVAAILKTDYASLGILLIFSLYFYRENKMIQAIAVFVILGYLGGVIQGIGFIAIIPFALVGIIFCGYNGEKGRNIKYIFYFFYPVHLICLYLISNMIF